MSNRAYGRDRLLATVEEFANSDHSPERYRAMAASIEKLDPRFDQHVRKEAERYLVTLALTPLAAHYDSPPDERLRALGTTVWPTALLVPPQPGETPEAYAERLCAGELALECKHVVPEYRSLQLSAVVWTRMRERAREAIQSCDACLAKPRYRDALARYGRYQRDVWNAANKAERAGKPSRWPQAGDHARSWSNPPLLELSSTGHDLFAGAPLDPDDYHRVLTAARRDSDVLGIFVESSARVAVLREALARARKAGFAQVALQVRGTRYPYPLGEYRLDTEPSPRRVRLRDADTIQILVQSLDARAATGDSDHRM